MILEAIHGGMGFLEHLHKGSIHELPHDIKGFLEAAGIFRVAEERFAVGLVGGADFLIHNDIVAA